MDRPLSREQLLARAVAYPYAAPLRSFLQLRGRTLPLPDDFDLGGRRPLLTYGANGSPQILARKLEALPELELPVLRAQLVEFDVVYSAHLSPYGAIPSTLQRSPGTVVPVFVAYPTPEQEGLLVASEPNYELRRLDGLEVRIEEGERIEVVDLFVSRHGCLALDGGVVALAAIEAAGRRFPTLGEVEVLERARHILAPEQDLERFVESSLDPGLAAARSAVLRGGAIALDL